jgi:hypothetical protein
MSGCSPRTEETIGGGNNGGRGVLEARGKGKGRGRRRKGDVVVEFRSFPFHKELLLSLFVPNSLNFFNLVFFISVDYLQRWSWSCFLLFGELRFMSRFKF